MTPIETLILASYFFVLLILAVYGWHRYYMVYLYMKHKDEQPVPLTAFDALPVITVQLPIFNEMYVVDRLIDTVCQLDYPRELLEIQVLDDSTDETQEIAELAVRRHAAQGMDIKYLHRDRPHRLQGRRARRGPEGGARPVRRHLRRRLHAQARLPDAHGPLLHRSQGGDGAGALGAHQPGLFAADEDPEHPARRAFRARARLAEPGRLLLQFQRHGRHVAPRGDCRRRRLAARHADRRPRPQLPHAAAGLAVRVRAGPCRAGRAAGRDERVQVAAASLGEGVDPDLPEADAPHPAVGPADQGEGRSLLPPVGQPELPVDVRAVGADGAVDDHPLQHGVVRDDAHRHPAVLRGDGVGGQLLHGVAARGLSADVDRPPEVPAVPDVDRHRPGGEQHPRGVRGPVPQAERVRADAEVRRRRRAPTTGPPRSIARPWPSSR